MIQELQNTSGNGLTATKQTNRREQAFRWRNYAPISVRLQILLSCPVHLTMSDTNRRCEVVDALYDDKCRFVGLRTWRCMWTGFDCNDYSVQRVSYQDIPCFRMRTFVESKSRATNSCAGCLSRSEPRWSHGIGEIKHSVINAADELSGQRWSCVQYVCTGFIALTVYYRTISWKVTIACI